MSEGRGGKKDMREGMGGEEWEDKTNEMKIRILCFVVS